MQKSNALGLAVLAAASVAVVALADPAYNALQNMKTKAAAGGADTVSATGEADGFGGPVKAEVTFAGDKIVGLKLTGDSETPEIGGSAMKTLTDAILKNQSLDGVDAVSGATWTSEGVFDAVNSAMGVKPEGDGAPKAQEVKATGLSHGLGFYSNGRPGPGKDDKDVGVYSFNEVVAYVLFDDGGRILDMEVDQLEVATPNYDGADMPKLTGFPGQSYNTDEDSDGTVDAVKDQDDDGFLAEVDGWKTKRERGDTYKLGSGTWQQEMDIFEDYFKGKTVEEVEQWYKKYCSDLNGRPLLGKSDKDEDVAKFGALTDADKKELDGIAGATMSVNDAHGNIVGAIVRAYENRRPVEAEKVAKIGLGFTNDGRVGPGKDDKDVGVYSFNTQAAGACFDGDGRIVALYTDVMEVATPNYDGADMPKLTGFPGQSYNADEDSDGTVDSVAEQTEEDFLVQVGAWKTKRERGDTYKLDSGTWAGEMDIFQQKFIGMTTGEVGQWYEKYCSEVNGRPLHGKSDKEEDVAKYGAFTDEDKKELDAVSGATMSLRDAHGDILGAIEKSWENAKDSNITVTK